MKTSVPTHSSSRLCASASISSLSKGQRWSRLPETGGKGQAGAQPRGRWGPGHLSTRGRGWLCALGRGAGVVTGAAWLWGRGMSPLGPSRAGGRADGTAHSVKVTAGRKPRLPCPHQPRTLWPSLRPQPPRSVTSVPTGWGPEPCGQPGLDPWALQGTSGLTAGCGVQDKLSSAG